jgi:hypothetical protein
MAPLCEVEVRVTVDGTLTFRYSMSFQPWSGSTTGGLRSATAYSVKKDRDYGSASIDGCRKVTGIAVSKVVSISGGGTPSSTRATAHKFSRPSLVNVQLEPHCLDLLRAESDSLQRAGAVRTLLAWSPLSAVLGESSAVHAAVMIGQTEWAELAESLSTVNKLRFIVLAQDARVHARSGYHYNNPSARAFWNAMADFYAAQAQE